MNTHYVVGISNPHDKKFFYIAMTGNLRKLASDLANSGKSLNISIAAKRLVIDMIRHGHHVEFTILKECSSRTLALKERKRWIRIGRDAGWPLKGKIH